MRTRRREGAARGRVRGGRALGLVVVVGGTSLVSVLGGPGVAGRATAAAPSPSAASWPAVLATSLTTSSGTWASVPMGRLDEPLNTFWQLFFLPAGGSRWSDDAASLAAATNGGLVLASPDGHSLLVGVRPTDLLSFSPLVSTSDGRSWSPGLPVTGLANRADALASAPSGATLALTSGAATADVLVTSRRRTGWTTLVTERALATSAAGRSCGVVALTAVAYDATGSALVGTACARPGVSGLYGEQAGSWRLVGPKLPSSLAGDRSEVLGVQQTSSGTAALIGLSGASGRSLVGAFRRAGTSAWSLSPALRVTSSEQLVSFGPATGSRLFVLLSSGSGDSRIAVLGGPRASSSELPGLSAKASTVSFASSGRVDALVAKGTTMTDYVLAAGSPRWKLSQTMSVGILYGSSG
ncbi:MAG: hypothetical protein JWO62_3594 [Acidimicrobiaceae bacterium]|nr:hypothetical protein [Acidimicrobiaceae bacterium]